MSKYNFPKVVVTGIGAVTSIGNSVQETWDALLAGKSGAAPITRFDTTEFDTKFAHEVKNFDIQQFINRKEAQRMDLFTHFAVASAAMAIEDSNLNLEQINKDRVGVIIASGIGGMNSYHEQFAGYLQRGKPDRISPFFIPMMIIDIASGHIAIKYGFRGPNYATVSACASSTHALADALMLIQRGSADVMVVGGAEASVTPMGIGGFNSMKALSTRNDDPTKASRPFDKERDGFVIGEGSGVLILETEEHALNRGAKIYAEFAGFGLSDDAFHITQPTLIGPYNSMKWAIEDANLSINDVDYINAHGTSTPFNDKNETAAIKELFGDHAYKLLISSSKSMVGHCLGAAGAVEAMISVLSVYNGIVPPTINYEFPDPECDLNYVPNTPIKKDINVALSNTFGFGGHNASVIFKKYTS
jgi:3-oxoacyl-[acyl-carrier-protein] synthase II